MSRKRRKNQTKGGHGDGASPNDGDLPLQADGSPEDSAPDTGPDTGSGSGPQADPGAGQRDDDGLDFSIDFTGAGARARGVSRAAEPTKAVVIHPFLRAQSGEAGGRDPDTRLSEAIGLARAIALDIQDARVIALSGFRPGTLFGSGKLNDIAELVEEVGAGLVIVDAPVTPVQQRNLEKAWNAKVLDRTGLILEIFGDRARTKEGRLQVELAHLSYQRSRLVRSWTHLERQRGGLGFIGGPGETQIEADRRLLQERITKIRRQLETVTRTRQLHRASRKKVPYPIVALVGYTNAGKSTLFNHLTQADVLAKDMLFATLDPSMRAITLPSRRTVILSDTVGFISDLPTTLVAAFRATLEEVLEADVLVHVRDAASPETDAQARDVAHVLEELGIGSDDPRPCITVHNKSDLLEPEVKAALTRRAAMSQEVTGAKDVDMVMSAQTGEGVETFLSLVDHLVRDNRTVLELDLNFGDGALLAWLHENADILERMETPEGRIRMRISVDDAAAGRLRKRLEDGQSGRETGQPGDAGDAGEGDDSQARDSRIIGLAAD